MQSFRIFALAEPLVLVASDNPRPKTAVSRMARVTPKDSAEAVEVGEALAPPQPEVAVAVAAGVVAAVAAVAVAAAAVVVRRWRRFWRRRARQTLQFDRWLQLPKHSESRKSGPPGG